MRYHECVASSAKTLQKMRRNQSGWRIEDLLEAAVLIYLRGLGLIGER